MLELLGSAVERMRSGKTEFCDARYQSFKRLNAIMVDGAVRSLNEDVVLGACLRARCKGSWGYASTSSLDKEAILLAASQAARNAKMGTAKGKAIHEMRGERGRHKAKVKLHPSKVPLEEKLSLIKDLDRAQRGRASVVNSNASYIESVKSTKLVNSFGAELEWEEVRGRLNCMSIASDGSRTEVYYDMVDGSGGYELFKSVDTSKMGLECAKEAEKMLRSKKCPSGEMTCITDPVISGLLAHEVMGHASEADEIVKKRSFLSDVVGRKVASDTITMVDDGTLKSAHGYIPFDDEGSRSSRTVIIDQGVYKGYMQSLETAAEMGVRPTGNGRAQGPHQKVFVRMTNTFFEAGDWKLEEMIEGVKHGVLTDRAISGMEDPVGGGFEAKALRGFLIENGEITSMLRGFTLTGKALEILKTTDAVGERMKLDGGTCGKGVEDFVPVSSGGPHCRSKIILGGG